MTPEPGKAVCVTKTTMGKPQRHPRHSGPDHHQSHPRPQELENEIEKLRVQKQQAKPVEKRQGEVTRAILQAKKRSDQIATARAEKVKQHEKELEELDKERDDLQTKIQKLQTESDELLRHAANTRAEQTNDTATGPAVTLLGQLEVALPTTLGEELAASLKAAFQTIQAGLQKASEAQAAAQQAEQTAKQAAVARPPSPWIPMKPWIKYWMQPWGQWNQWERKKGRTSSCYGKMPASECGQQDLNCLHRHRRHPPPEGRAPCSGCQSYAGDAVQCLQRCGQRAVQ